MKKLAFCATAVIFGLLVWQFYHSEVIRYDIARSQVQQIIFTDNVTEFQLHDIVEVAEKTLLDIHSPAAKLIQRKSIEDEGYVIKGGSVLSTFDYWMMGSIERKAEPQEMANLYSSLFNIYADGFYFSSAMFYIWHVVLFSLMSALPWMLSLLASIMPAATFKYATAVSLILLVAVVKQVRADDTSFEVDLFNQGGQNRYEFFLMNFNSQITTLLYIPSNSVIAATGPNMTLGNGSLSLLGGLHTGSNQNGFTITDISAWYIYFGKIFNQKLDYITFGLYDRPLYSDNWWIWFKQQFNLPVTEKFGIGIREDTTIDATGWRATYGPAIKFQWSSLTTYVHCRMGGEKNILLIRASVPIQ